mmetsp:Transcript_16086/g.28599  ORF Transcript_16086/g.28599 Transcript_16086/m.28599 type:complete len:275 (-) Transcript_16086:507-1331(-)
MSPSPSGGGSIRTRIGAAAMLDDSVVGCGSLVVVFIVGDGSGGNSDPAHQAPPQWPSTRVPGSDAADKHGNVADHEWRRHTRGCGSCCASAPRWISGTHSVGSRPEADGPGEITPPPSLSGRGATRKRKPPSHWLPWATSTTRPGTHAPRSPLLNARTSTASPTRGTDSGSPISNSSNSATVGSVDPSAPSSLVVDFRTKARMDIWVGARFVGPLAGIPVADEGYSSDTRKRRRPGTPARFTRGASSDSSGSVTPSTTSPPLIANSSACRPELM